VRQDAGELQAIVPVLVRGVGVLGAPWRRPRLWRLGFVACPNVLEDGGDDVRILDAAL
jgi:hypothetical protein